MKQLVKVNSLAIALEHVNDLVGRGYKVSIESIVKKEKRYYRIKYKVNRTEL